MKLETIIKNIGLVVYAATAYLGIRLLQVIVATLMYFGDSKLDGLVVVDNILTVLLYIALTGLFIVPFILMKQKNNIFLLAFQGLLCIAAPLYLIVFCLDLISGISVGVIFGFFREIIFFAASFYLVTLFVTSSGAIKMYFGNDTTYLSKAFFKLKSNDTVPGQQIQQNQPVEQTTQVGPTEISQQVSPQPAVMPPVEQQMPPQQLVVQESMPSQQLIPEPIAQAPIPEPMSQQPVPEVVQQPQMPMSTPAVTVAQPEIPGIPMETPQPTQIPAQQQPTSQPGPQV